jgi:hypothetical protein
MRSGRVGTREMVSRRMYNPPPPSPGPTPVLEWSGSNGPGPGPVHGCIVIWRGGWLCSETEDPK